MKAALATLDRPLVGRYTYHIRSYELGPGQRASFTTLCHLLQESAGLHAHELDASPAQLLERGMTWFLARMRIQVERYPGWRDAVTVETWPSEVAAPFVYRDFRVAGEDGEPIAAASTSWLLMDMVRRRPMRRFPQSVLDLHPIRPVRVLSPRGDQGGATLSPEPIRLPVPGEAEHQEEVEVRGSDIDINGHVNHVFYIDQIEKSCPRDPLEGGQEDRGIVEFEIEYKLECHAGDRLAVRSTKVGGVRDSWLHSLVRQADSREVTRARTRWGRHRFLG